MHTANSADLSNRSVTYDGKIAGLYDLEETLGSGHFAVVKLARHVFTGEKVAVKVVDKTKLDEVSKAHLFQEVRCMKLVQHPNVVRLYEVIDTQTKLYLILELGDGGDLYDYIMKHDGGLTEDLARKYFRQIVRAISYCHQLHVVHRDLKPENVVFFEKLGLVKLTDFGFSNKFSPGEKLETSCGSLAYSAPEILLGDSYDAPAVDIWSLGVILYMLVCGQPPFERANDSETLTMIMDCKYTIPSHVTINCQKLIASMLVRDPEKRASLEQIAGDAWLKQNTFNDNADYLPLVSQQQVGEEDHSFIIKKMINGNIATKEEILHSLDRKKYNHITATYFLLAERKLRQKRQEQFQIHRPQMFVASKTPMRITPIIGTCEAPADIKLRTDHVNKLHQPDNIEVGNLTTLAAEVTTDKRNRKCSVVKEEDEDDDACEYIAKTDFEVDINRRGSISEGRMNQSIRERGLDIQTKLAKNQVSIVDSSNIANLKISLEKNNIIAKPRSSQHHNQQSKLSLPCTGTVPYTDTQKRSPNDLVDTSRYDILDRREYFSGIKDLEISKIKNKNSVLGHRRTKINKICTPSCSSSEASDDDTKSRKKKLNKFGGDTPSRLRIYRRDSHDDSSDSQDQATLSSGPNNSSFLLASTNVSNSSTSSTEKKVEQNKSSDSRNSQSKQKKRDQHTDKSNRILRRRLRESHSLDRITEVQEYDQRQRHIPDRNDAQILNFIITSKNGALRSSSNLTSISVVAIKEDNVNMSTTPIKLNSFYDMNAIDEIDLLFGVKITKAIQVTGSKCSVTLKKIRRLGKYFPVVNFT